MKQRDPLTEKNISELNRKIKELARFAEEEMENSSDNKGNESPWGPMFPKYEQ